MAADPVPWMVSGGIEHSVNVARLLSYAAFNGEEGIIGPRDLEVRELAVPGASVRVFPGACSIFNRAVGAKYEAYAARFPTETEVAIAATGSGGGRTDLIVARVENPYEPGEPWDEPSSEAIADGTAQFVFPRVISGVPAGTKTVAELGLGYSAIPLARVTLPASTGTVLQSHITDLRKLTAVRRHETFNIIAPVAAQALTSATFVNWPSIMNLDVDIPEWATHVQFRALLGGVVWGAGTGVRNANGDLRIEINNEIFTQATAYNLSTDTGTDRVTLMAGSPGVAIPAAMRGTTQSVRVEGRKTSGNSNLQVDAAAMLSLEVKFTQQPESNL